MATKLIYSLGGLDSLKQLNWKFKSLKDRKKGKIEKYFNGNVWF